MNREHLQLLMNRAVDGVATVDEREQLARALRADPMLQSEYDELQAVHASTTSLFHQLALKEDFSKRIMRRIQTDEVPSDEGLENVRLPAQRRLRGRRMYGSTFKRRDRIYAIIAAVSAAAAVLLAIGVLSGFFARAGIGTQGVESTQAQGESITAEGGRGGPGTGGLNRTDPSTPQPSGTQVEVQPTDNQGHEQKPSPVVKTPDENQQAPAPKRQPRKGIPLEPKKPDTTAPVPEKRTPAGIPGLKPVKGPDPKPGEIVKKEDTPPAQPEQPKGEVDNGKTDDKSEAKPTKRVLLGKLQVLSGKAELVAQDGNTTRMHEQDQEVYSGDRIRTRYDATVVLQLTGGQVTLGKDTQVVLDTDNRLTLERYNGKDKGLVALDRSPGQSGDSIDLRVDDYDVYLMSGCTVIERRRHGMTVSKSIGFATVTHDTLGSVLLSEDSGYTTDIEFGKDFDPPQAGEVKLPGCAAEARTQTVMAGIDTALTARKFTERGERAYVNRNLPIRLNRLMEHAVTCDTVITLLNNAIKNEKLNGAAIVGLVGDLEIAYGNIEGMSPETITGHAARAALVADGLDQWKDYFYRLMRPPVDPKSKPCPNTKPVQDPEKLKRGDDTPARKVKSTPQNGSNPAKQEDNEPAN